MKRTNRNLKQYLRRSLGEKIVPEREAETIEVCRKILCEQALISREQRTGFFQYLSDIFRFEGIPLLVMQAATLLTVCLLLKSLADVPWLLPVFIPLFVLAVIPAFLKDRFYHTSELEAVTRASGAQIILAKLILAGGANLVCITILLCLEVPMQNSCGKLGQMILYCLVPYLACMVSLLRLLRTCKKEHTHRDVLMLLVFYLLWCILARTCPQLYEASAIGGWFVAFILFFLFFAGEIHFMMEMRKGGKMYGIIA